MKFRETTLGEISKGGSYGLGASSSTDSTGPKFLRTTDIVSGTIDWSNVPYCSADLATIRKYKLFNEDIVISRTGANAGVNCLVIEPPENAIFAGYLVRFQINRDLADARYVSYVLRSSAWKEYVEVTRTGSAQPQFNAVLMSQFPIALPSLNIQKAISALLSAVDSKISANKALSKTLESIAQTIFKSWFIDFDPVKAKMAGEKPAGMDAATAALFPDTMEESELGFIPNGWRSGVLEEIIEIYDSKRIPISGAERRKRAGIYPYYGATGILDYIDDYIFEGPHVLVGEDGTVITALGTPLVQYVWDKFWVSNHAHVLQAKEGFSVEQLKLLIERIQISNFITGAVQPKLNQGNLKSIPCVVPSFEVSAAFASIIEPFFGNIRRLASEAKTLIKIRDSLLPRFISGELQIPEKMLAS